MENSNNMNKRTLQVEIMKKMATRDLDYFCKMGYLTHDLSQPVYGRNLVAPTIIQSLSDVKDLKLFEKRLFGDTIIKGLFLCFPNDR